MSASRWTFPQSWDGLVWKHQRAELITYARSIIEIDPSSMESEIDDIVHFLFDDTSLADDPESLIGIVLLGHEEVPLVKQVTSSLNNILNDVGDRPTSVFFAHPHWPEVVSAARALEQCLIQMGEAILSREPGGAT